MLEVFFFLKDLQPTTGGSMKNVPAPLSCAAAAHPELAYLFFPLIALTLLLFAWPDLAQEYSQFTLETFK